MLTIETTERKAVEGLDGSSTLLMHELRYMPGSVHCYVRGARARVADGGADALYRVSDGPSKRLG
ncbi:MAG TPA: hypothetical protein VE258_16515 [Ktedonobacterales bacterium]|nr:hypothetical protein [Ktedonobacterales bacterium]